jgi:hypothetical protein
MLEFTKVDLARAETVMKALKRGKYELEGDEVLAFAQAFAWISVVFDRIKADLETPVELPKVEAPEPKPKGKKKDAAS